MDTGKVILLVEDNKDDKLHTFGALKKISIAYVRKPVDFSQFTDAVKSLGLFWLPLEVPSRSTIS